MKYIFILLLGLITFQVNAQTKIIGSTTTAGGDLQGTYPNPTVKSNIINRTNLTASLRDSLNRIRKDTSIIVGSGTTNYAALASTFARYNRVKIRCLLPTAGIANVILPTSSDTLKHTEFKVSLYAQDSVSGQINVTGFGGFAIYYNGTDIVTQEPNISLNNRETVTVNTVFHNSNYYWISEISKDWISEALESGASGITALTGDVTASGTGSVTATIAADAVTSAKILNGTIVSADIASQTVDSLDIKNSSITTVKLETGAVTSLKVLDNSLTGSDLTYLTLRAGTTGNASLQLTSGTDKTTLTGGEILYNGRFAVGIGSSKRRLATTNDAAASNGQIPIGNGTDFTTAALTAGYAQTVTNGTGTITILPDTMLVVPFIPNAEISNNTRNGYYWNRTSGNFGHQFYRQGYRVFNNSSGAASSAATGLSLSKSGYGASVNLSMSTLASYIDLSAYTSGFGGAGALTVATRGTSVRAFITDLSTNVPAAASFQIDGTTSLEYITDNAVTTLLLPEVVNIAASTLASANQVCPGYRLTVVLDTGGSVTFDAAGSDVIYVHNNTGFAGTYVSAGSTQRVIDLIALDVGVWIIKP